MPICDARVHRRLPGAELPDEVRGAEPDGARYCAVGSGETGWSGAIGSWDDYWSPYGFASPGDWSWDDWLSPGDYRRRYFLPGDSPLPDDYQQRYFPMDDSPLPDDYRGYSLPDDYLPRAYYLPSLLLQGVPNLRYCVEQDAQRA